VLTEHGWTVWTGLLDSEAYGVPQTRRRAILLAARDREVTPPRPTHSRYHPRSPEKLDYWVEPWVSIQDAFEGSGPWAEYTHLGDVRTSRGTLRPVERPAGTVVASADNGNYRWTDFEFDELVTPEQFGVLQTFPVGHPWQGSLAAQFRQVGNAVPPLLASRILEVVL
jgi:DNA (cytosine-5)-methyltransferase 1